MLGLGRGRWAITQKHTLIRHLQLATISWYMELHNGMDSYIWFFKLVFGLYNLLYQLHYQFNFVHQTSLVVHHIFTDVKWISGLFLSDTIRSTTRTNHSEKDRRKSLYESRNITRLLHLHCVQGGKWGSRANFPSNMESRIILDHFTN